MKSDWIFEISIVSTFQISNQCVVPNMTIHNGWSATVWNNTSVPLSYKTTSISEYGSGSLKDGDGYFNSTDWNAALCSYGSVLTDGYDDGDKRRNMSMPQNDNINIFTEGLFTNLDAPGPEFIKQMREYITAKGEWSEVELIRWDTGRDENKNIKYRNSPGKTMTFKRFETVTQIGKTGHVYTITPVNPFTGWKLSDPIFSDRDMTDEDICHFYLEEWDVMKEVYTDKEYGTNRNNIFHAVSWEFSETVQTYLDNGDENLLPCPYPYNHRAYASNNTYNNNNTY